MYVAKKDDGKTYVYIRNGKTYVSTLHIKGISAGEDAQVSLAETYLLTVTATGFTYSDKFTITTTVDGVSYTGSLSMYVEPNTSVTVKAVDTAGETRFYHTTYVKLDGTNTKERSYTFTMDTSHDITFTDGIRLYVGSGK